MPADYLSEVIIMFRSNRVAQIPPYMFAKIKKKKEEMVQSGIDVIDLGMGDPDLPTPAHIVNKLVEEMAFSENLKYPNFQSCREFREAVADYYKRHFRVELDPETISSRAILITRPVSFIGFFRLTTREREKGHKTAQCLWRWEEKKWMTTRIWYEGC
jgi:hypothetical protein